MLPSRDPRALRRWARVTAVATAGALAAAVACACKPTQPPEEPVKPATDPVATDETSPEQREPTTRPAESWAWERARARARVRLSIADPRGIADVFDRLADLYGTTDPDSGQVRGSSDIAGAFLKSAAELGIPGPLLDGMDEHGTYHLEWVFPWNAPRPPDDGAAAPREPPPGSHAVLVIPSKGPDPRSLADTTAAINLMRHGDGPDAPWLPTARSPAPLVLGSTSGHIALASAPDTLPRAAELAGAGAGGHAMLLEIFDVHHAAVEFVQYMGKTLHDPGRDRFLKIAERVDDARATLDVGAAAAGGLVLDVAANGRFAGFDLLRFLGPPRTAATALERRLPDGPVALALFSLGELGVVQDWVASTVEGIGESSGFNKDARELGRDVVWLMDHFVGDAAMGVYAYGPGEHTLVFAAPLRGDKRVRARVPELTRAAAQLAGRYSGFVNALTNSDFGGDLEVKTRAVRRGRARAQVVAVKLPPALVPERRGSYLAFGKKQQFEFTAFEQGGVAYFAIGPGTAAFVADVGRLGRARDKPDAPPPRGSLAAGEGSRRVHAVDGGCQICVVFDSVATTRSLLGRSAETMSDAEVKKAVALIPTLGIDGQGGWAFRLDAKTARVRGEWPASTLRSGDAKTGWNQFLLLLGKRKDSLRKGFNWLLGEPS